MQQRLGHSMLCPSRIPVDLDNATDSAFSIKDASNTDLRGQWKFASATGAIDRSLTRQATRIRNQTDWTFLLSDVFNNIFFLRQTL